MMMAGKKAKDFKGTLRRLLRYLKLRQNQLIAVFIAAILSTVFMVVGPKIMGNAITEVFEGAYGKLQVLRVRRLISMRLRTVIVARWFVRCE